MDLRQLTTFTAVANARGFTRAALALNYAQSSVTAQIQALEEELGVPLFDRLGHKVALTDAGRRLQVYAARMLALAEETRAAVTESAEPSGTVVIGVVESLCTYRLPPLLRAYRQRCPHVQLLLHSLPISDPWRGLFDGTMDAALNLSETQPVPGLEVEPLPREPLVVIAAPDHPLAGARRVTPADLESEPVLLTEGACGYRNLFEATLTRAGVTPASTLEFSSVEAIKQCVMAGVGIAVLPEMAVHEELAHGRLVALRWSERDFAIGAYFVWHKDKWQSPALSAFREMVHEVLGAGCAPIDRRAAGRYSGAAASALGSEGGSRRSQRLMVPKRRTLMASNRRVIAAEQTLIAGAFQAERAITIEDGFITAVRPLPDASPDEAVERFPRRLAVPGTLNAHNHSFQSMLRGIADDCNFFDWRDKALYGYTPYMTEEAVYHGARFAFAEMIRNGVTTVCDFFYIHRDGNANDHAVIRAARDLGMRIVLARTMYDWEGAPTEYQESIPDAVARTRELWQAYRGSHDVHVCPAPHSPHAASPAMIQAGSRLAEELDIRFHIHVAEGRYERDTIREQYGKTPMRWLESLGLAMERMTAIHCVWLEDDDIRLMGERDTRLVYNPASNMFLGDGVTRIPDMLAAGVKIGLGSDGGCSNNRVSVFDEMRMCSLLQKVTHLSSEVVPAETAFAMGTLGSAQTLGLPAGSIAPGHYADFALLDMDDPSLQPPWSYEKNVVYAMTPHAIREVIVGGDTVFRDGELTRVGWSEVLGGLRDVTAGWPRP